MTILLDIAIEHARGLSAERQDEIARLILDIAGGNEAVHQLSPDEEASFRKSLSQAGRREFATEEQVRALFAKHAS